VAVPLAIGGGTFSVIGRYPLREARETMRLIRRMFWFAIPVLLLFAATSGSFLAKRSLAPVGNMAARAAAISASTLHERLPVSGGDELVRLARVVNDLLDRLERSFEQQRRFMADASHELRTPTAVVRSEADISLSREHRSEDEYRDAIAVIQDASRRLTRIVDDLFLLARADSGHQVVRVAPLYLEEVVDDATRAVRPLAERRGVRIDINQLEESPLRGDADLLGRLVLNLLDNAIKHSPSDSSVEVRLAKANGTYALTVADRGPGIPPEAHHRIFDRFYRVDVARAREEQTATSGAGLGLSIARWIAEAHGGRLELAESRPGRTEFRLTLPV
jgi:heavy metal sensor kinase